MKKDNIVSPSVLRRAMQKAVKPKLIPVTLVGAADEAGYSIVEEANGEQRVVYNPVMPNTALARAYIARNQYTGEWQIVSRRPVGAVGGRVDTPTTAEHHSSHEYPGSDTVWVHIDQFLPLLVMPTTGFIVQIFGGLMYIGTDWVKIENQTFDLSSYQPAAGAKWVLIQVDSTGTISVVEGSTLVSKGQLNYTNLPVPDADNMPLCGVKLYDGQTKLTRDPRPGKLMDFLDVRLSGYATSGGAGFDMGAEIHAASASAISDDDEVGFWENVADALRKITWANIKTTLQTFFETLFPRKYAGKTVAPTVNDDSDDGYAVGDRWLDETNDKEYVALDVTVGAAVWVEVGGGGIEVIDTRAVVMATTIDAGRMGLTTDTNELCVSLGGGSWLVSPFQLLTADPDPDIGLYAWNNRLGYGVDYVSDKLLANVWIGSNPSTTEGGIWIDKTASPYVFKIYLNAAERTIMVDFSTALGYLVHYPFDAEQAVKVWSGMSVEVGLNGRPIINEYETDMGAYPAPRALNGGTF